MKLIIMELIIMKLIIILSSINGYRGSFHPRNKLAWYSNKIKRLGEFIPDFDSMVFTRFDFSLFL